MIRSRLKIDGTLVDLEASAIRLQGWSPVDIHGLPSLSFTRTGVKITKTDSYLNKSVTLECDLGDGAGWLPRWNGYVDGYSDSFSELGVLRHYKCVDVKDRCNFLPVVNSNDGSSTLYFNQDPDDPAFVVSRAGRSVGQILFSTLSQVDTLTALRSLGVSGANSAGTGAVATCTVSGGVVIGVTLSSGGSGYTSAPQVFFFGVGTGAVATATVVAGVVTGISVSSGGTGYTSPPEVWVSPLPSDTLSDLAKLTLVPPYPVTVSGDRLWSALEGVLQSAAPNHYLYLSSDAHFRVGDLRTPDRQITLTFGDDPVLPPQVARSVRDSYSRVVVRGQPLAEPVLLSLSTGGIVEDFGHDGITSDDAKLAWKLADFAQPGGDLGQALAYATINTTSHTVTSLSVVNQGYGYDPAHPPTVTISAPGGSPPGVTATARVDASSIVGGKVTSVTLLTAGTKYTSQPSVYIAPPGNPGRDTGSVTAQGTNTVTIRSDNNKRLFAANFFDQTASGKKGVIFLYASVLSGVDSTISRRIISHTALTAGGTSVMTLDRPLPAGVTFAHYVITGTAMGGGLVWRQYKVADTDIASKLQSRFSYPVPWTSSAGTQSTMTSFPQATVLYSYSGAAPYFESPMPLTIDPDSGAIVFDKPVVTLYGTSTNLGQGGTHTDGVPNDIRVLLPVAKDKLNVTKPADVSGNPQYTGTSYTEDGLQRTLYVNIPSWRDPLNATYVDAYASDLLDSVKDSTIDVTVSVCDFLTSAITPGLAVKLAADGWTTGLESVPLFVHSVEIEWQHGGGSKWMTHLRLSNRRSHLTADNYLHPTRLETLWGSDETYNPFAPVGEPDTSTTEDTWTNSSLPDSNTWSDNINSSWNDSTDSKS